MFEAAQELWWGQIHGPRRLKNEIQNVLLTPGKGLWIDGGIPWPETLQQLVKNELGEKNSQVCLTFQSAGELQGLEPADLIFRLNPEARSRYMPGKPLAEYIRDNRLLETHILWLSGLELERHEAWFGLSRELARLKTGLQVICQGQLGSRKHPNLVTLHVKDYSTEFDHILFAMQLAAESGASPDMQMYYSYLTVGLAGGRVEEIPGLMQAPDALTRQPERYASDLGFSREELERILHKVQVKVLLPILEERQERLVDELSGKIRLPFYDEYGRKFQELYEVELRNMHYLYKNGSLRLSQPQAGRLEQLYQLRNLVAHRKLVPGETVVDFLL